LHPSLILPLAAASLVPPEARRAPMLAGALALAFALCSVPAAADPIPPGWQASGLRPIGYTDLDGRRGGTKLAIKKVGDRWVLYKGGNGIEVIDVTNPEDPPRFPATAGSF